MSNRDRMLAMPFRIGQAVEVTDGRSRRIGRFEIDAVEPDVMCGTFAHGQDYEQVERLFTEFAEAAEAQALGVAERCMGLVDALDLRLIDPESEERVQVEDFQIWGDGNASCRLRALSPQFL